MLKLKDIVKDNKVADFVMCRDGDLWYKTREEGFDFPIPLSEVKGGTYTATMKAITLMRYIRKQLNIVAEYSLVAE